MMPAQNLDQPGGLLIAAVAVASLVAGVGVTAYAAIADRRRRNQSRRQARVDARDHAREVADQLHREHVQIPGEQPICEFTAGPTGFGLWFRDDLLAQVVTTWQRELEGGVR
jgi:type II secretory pathway pseudopilin PulG